jgi:hypothetical protein
MPRQSRSPRSSSRSSSRGRSARGMPGPGVFELFLRPRRSLPVRLVGLLIRLRAEITLLTVFIVVWVWLARHLPLWGARAVLLAALVLVFAVPVSRRYVTARMWCVCTRHRVRAALLKSRYPSMTYDGKLPYLLWSRPSPVGERVRVWLPAGLSVKDLDRMSDTLATACWARSARLTPVRGQAALVVLDIIRRDPLTGDLPVDTGTTGTGAVGTPVLAPDGMGQLIPLPPRDQPATDNDTAPVPPASPAPSTPPATPRTSGKSGTAATTTSETPSVRGVGGMDVSDYV